jgi:hypothetical protein
MTALRTSDTELPERLNATELANLGRFVHMNVRHIQRHANLKCDVGVGRKDQFVVFSFGSQLAKRFSGFHFCYPYT